MKKFLLIIAVLSLILCSCELEPEGTEQTTAAQTEPATEPQPIETTTEATLPLSSYQTPMVSFAAPAVTENHGGSLLEYTYQIMELLMEDPQVSEWVTLELINRTDFSATSGPQLLAEAKESGESISLSLFHTPARLDRGVLSLISTQVVSGNGPKATGTMASATFDLITGRKLSLKEILIPGYDAQVLSNAVIQALEPLASEGALYSDYAYVVSELFASNAPVENWYLSETALCVYFAPYEIAPYNLGNVTAEIPYDLLLDLLRKEYFPDEVLGLVGNLKLSSNLDILQEKNHFRDLILDSNGPEWVITVEGAIEDLRIESTDLMTTLFASATLCQGDAIIVQTTREVLESLTVTYRSGGETIVIPLSSLL